MDNAPVEIGTDRQMFVDDFWMAESTGVERRLHSPVRREAAISSEFPWDSGITAYNTIVFDGGRYRMWYRTDDQYSGNAMRHAYAESMDGIVWEKPTVGLIEYNGSKENNLVFEGPSDCFAPFVDDNPDAAHDERYKAVARGPDRQVLEAYVSADGLKWRKLREEPILTDPPFDSHNVAMWDSWRGEYVLYARGSAGSGGPFKGGVRWVRRSTSKDFLNWSPLVDIDTGETPIEHFYTNSCVRYERAPGTYIMFPSRFVVERTPDPEWEYGDGVNDIVFMSSRDGLRFDRSFKEAFVRPALDSRNWHERGIYMDVGILHTSPTEMSIYGVENMRYPSVNIRRYTLRTDGFVSVNAGFESGEFTTRPLIFEGGELELNYSTSAVGSVQVEIQDAEGHVLPGYGLGDCPEKFGDEIDGVISWKAGPSVGGLAGQGVQLRFVLKDADLYAFRFR
jgi:hypothetical protein